MTRRTQCVVLTLLGTLGIKLVVTDTYLRYVHTWMKVPVLLTSALLLALAVRLAVAVVRGRTDDHEDHKPDHRASASTWLLVLPVLAVFTVSPPALGAYAAERSTTPVADDAGFTALPDRALTPMTLGDFTSRAQWGATLADHPVALTGFVSRGAGGAWFVTRLAISCCAADAVAYRVRVLDVPAPARDRWVRVTGTWVDPGRTPVPRIGAPGLRGTGIGPVAEPTDPYE